MHTAIKYSRSSADENALSDIKEYLNDTQLTILEEVARDVELGNQDIDHLKTLMDFVGIRRFSFGAFCRKHCPEKFLLWRKENN